MRPRAGAILLLPLAGVLIALFAPSAASRRLVSHLSIHPRTGAPGTQFKVSFVARLRTGRSGTTIRRMVVNVHGPSGVPGCVSSASRRVAVRHAGTRVNARLDPARFGGAWCAGSFHGQVTELVLPFCPDGRACPAFSARRRVLARFAFTVIGTAANSAPPTFAGLEQATFCAGGVPSQSTRVYRLSWRSATDPATPSSQIVYEIFMATTPGGEDFSQPSWVTSPGATNFDTPAQPGDGDRYFVVRARDQGGATDQNAVERAGVDIC